MIFLEPEWAKMAAVCGRRSPVEANIVIGGAHLFAFRPGWRIWFPPTDEEWKNTINTKRRCADANFSVATNGVTTPLTKCTVASSLIWSFSVW